jgi:hypothetical protein
MFLDQGRATSAPNLSIPPEPTHFFVLPRSPTPRLPAPHAPATPALPRPHPVAQHPALRVGRPARPRPASTAPHPALRTVPCPGRALPCLSRAPPGLARQPPSPAQPHLAHHVRGPSPPVPAPPVRAELPFVLILFSWIKINKFMCHANYTMDQ